MRFSLVSPTKVKACNFVSFLCALKSSRVCIENKENLFDLVITFIFLSLCFSVPAFSNNMNKNLNNNSKWPIVIQYCLNVIRFKVE